VLSKESYSYNRFRTFKIKSFIRERSTKDEAGKNIILKEKVVCFWSKNFDDREKLEERIASYLKSPSKLKASNSYGIKKYLKVQNIDGKTGEVKDVNPHVAFNREKYERDVKLDGYYAIVTSLCKKSKSCRRTFTSMLYSSLNK